MLLSHHHERVHIGFHNPHVETVLMAQAALEAEDPTSTAQREAVRLSQRLYVEQLLDRTGLSPRALAQGAGFSSSTLTRFLNEPGHKGLLSTSILSKLQNKYGLRWTPPEVSALLTEIEALRLPSALVEAAKSLGADIVLHRQADLAMEGVGLMQGDVAIVSLNRRPRNGEMALVSTPEARIGAAVPTVRLYIAPHLMAMPRAPQTAEELRPLLVDDVTVKILGTVVGTLRWTG